MNQQPFGKAGHAGEPGRPPDLSRSAVARYLQLATLFRRRIEQEAWTVGQQIPTVDQLAAEYGVARATIRQALGQLEQDGLIERLRAKGTFVRAAPSQHVWCEVATDWAGLLQSREGARIEVLSDVSDCDGSIVRQSIGLRAPLYRHVRRRHWRQDQAFLVADLYLDQRLSSQIKDEDLRTKTALRLAAEVPGIQIVDARQSLTIGLADVEAAEALHVPLNAPVAFVHRAAVDANGILVASVEDIYRGDVIRVDFKLK
jgi:GntR family transcriptional regulator